MGDLAERSADVMLRLEKLEKLAVLTSNNILNVSTELDSVEKMERNNRVSLDRLTDMERRMGMDTFTGDIT